MAEQKVKPTHSQPDGFEETGEDAEDMVVNDSFGEVTISDSTGLDEDLETEEERTGFVKKDPGDGRRED